MVTAKRGWHNPRKETQKYAEGRCPYCHTIFRNLGEHIHDCHKGEKGWEKDLEKHGIYLRKRFN